MGGHFFISINHLLYSALVKIVDMVDDIADRNVNEAALRHAAMHGMLEEVTRLIAAGTNVDATDEYVRIIVIFILSGL